MDLDSTHALAGGGALVLKVLWDRFITRATRADEAEVSALGALNATVGKLVTEVALMRERMENTFKNHGPRISEIEKKLAEHEVKLTQLEPRRRR